MIDTAPPRTPVVARRESTPAVVKGAIAVAALSALGLWLVPRTEPPPGAAASATPPIVIPTALDCGPRAIPEGTLCIPLPPPPGATVASRRSMREKVNESIPRRPDRPDSPMGLLYPLPGPPIILFGFDTATDAEDVESQKNPVSVDLSAERGEEVKVVPLRAQKGLAEVIAMGELFGKTVVTLHEVEEGGRKRQYIAIHARLDAFAPDLKVDQKVKEGEPLGYTGDSGTTGFVHLHFEVRQVRDEIDVRPLDMARLCDQAVSIPIDLRNVLADRSGD
ncbi:MAG: peptidoglycan DD-metalloendopeptidase family protein [Polyangiaceae bacterium]